MLQSSNEKKKEKEMKAEIEKKEQEKNFAPGDFCPQSRHLVRLAHKIGEVRFSTKFKPKMCFSEKRIREGFRKNE